MTLVPSQQRLLFNGFAQIGNETLLLFCLMERLILSLKKNNVRIGVVGGKIQLIVPDGVDVGEVLREVRRSEQEILDFYQIDSIGVNSVIQRDGEVVLFKRGGREEGNLFFIHDGSGDILGYRPLVAHLDKHSAWGIRSDLIFHGGPLDIGIADIAHRCIEKVKSIQQQGPYTLIGWSHGGIIAHEMVRIMHPEYPVKALFMIDTDLDIDPNLNEKRIFQIQEERKLLQDVLPEVEIPRDVQDVTRLWEIMMPVLCTIGPDKVREIMPGDFKNMIAHVERQSVVGLVNCFNAIRSIEHAVRNRQRVNSVDVMVYYIKAINSSRNNCAMLRKYARKFEYVEIEGTHVSIMQKEGVKKLGGIFDRILQNIS